LTGENASEAIAEEIDCAANILEESKDENALRPRGRKSDFEQQLQANCRATGWEKTFDTMWRGVRGYMDMSPNQLLMVL